MIEKFLSREERDRALELALAREGDLRPAKIGDVGEHNPERRSSRVLRGQVDARLPWFLPRVETVIPDILDRLQTKPFPIQELELQLTVHQSGDFYKVHRDNSEDKASGRRVSYVYYFHQTPKRFTGGDLLLYDTDVEAGGHSAAFTRLGPVDNSIVFFPSAYFHQVTKVRCETDDFGDGRFTLNGWINA
jgi:Rps23 Pro-64 3,4-dihydroxylase Tpa1-like proline 4-hydroxylase